LSTPDNKLITTNDELKLMRCSNSINTSINHLGISNLYSVLGLNRSASLTDIQEAYLNIAISNHPNRNNSIHALYLYQNASYAYSILGKDPLKRKEYDNSIEVKEMVQTIEEILTEVSNIALPAVSNMLTIFGDVFDRFLTKTSPLDVEIIPNTKKTRTEFIRNLLSSEYINNMTMESVRKELNELEIVLSFLKTKKQYITKDVDRNVDRYEVFIPFLSKKITIENTELHTISRNEDCTQDMEEDIASVESAILLRKKHLLKLMVFGFK
jgi:hypothetical protein